MATNTTIQAINNAVPNVGLDTPHPEEPTRKLLNAILRDYLQAIESLEDDTVTKSQIVQVFGDSQTAVISQDALTDYLSNLSFLQLADTPYVYAGSIGKFIRVNAAGDGLEFFELGAAAISNSFNDLVDKPDFSSIPQLVSAADFASLPATGDVTKTYLTLDDGKLYYWSGSAYVVFTNDTATWAGIGGDIGDNAALMVALNDKADAADVALKSTSFYAGAGMTGGGDLSEDRTLSVDIGTGAGQVMAGDDSRVTGLGDGAYAQIGTDIAPLGQDGLVPSANLPSQFSGDYDDLTNKPTLFSGAYGDLSGKPTLGTVAALDVDTDADLAANSDALIPSQKAVKAYVDNSAIQKIGNMPDVVFSTENVTAGGNPIGYDALVMLDKSTWGFGLVTDVANTQVENSLMALAVEDTTYQLGNTVFIPSEGGAQAFNAFEADRRTNPYHHNSARMSAIGYNGQGGAGIRAICEWDAVTKAEISRVVYFDGENIEWRYDDNGTLNSTVSRLVPTIPASPTSTGKRGQLAADADYLYYCYAADSWASIPKNTFKTPSGSTINWLEVSTSTFLIEPEHAGISLWVTVDCVITVSAHSTLPTGFNCEILKADSGLIVSVVATGSDTIRDGKSIIVSDTSVFKSPSAGVIGLVGDAS